MCKKNIAYHLPTLLNKQKQTYEKRSARMNIGIYKSIQFLKDISMQLNLMILNYMQ